MAYFAYFGNPRGILVNSGGYSWVAAFYTVLVLFLLLRPDSRLAAVFRSGFLTHLGKVSFAVFLFHQGVNVGLHYVLRGAAPSSSDSWTLTVSFLAAAATYGLASASWKWLEGPIQRASRSRFPYERSPVPVRDARLASVDLRSSTPSNA
jgi:peptidoglycan/LPS O-acetylase OafA/YrhL